MTDDDHRPCAITHQPSAMTHATALDPIAHWDTLLRDADAAALCRDLTGRQRVRRLRFGDRVLCPFLRPFFLDAAEEARVKHVAETLWTLGERVARVAIDSPSLLRQ